MKRFELRRVTDAGDLALTQEHEAIAKPRRGVIHWDAFDPSPFDAAVLDEAAALWETRAVQELRSLALFTEIASKLHVLGAPLDWSGAFARMITDEVRHTDLCLRMCAALGRPVRPTIEAESMAVLGEGTARAQVRHAIIAAFCIGETISGTMFRRAHRAANVELAREVVAAIVVDETFHGELGWELGALLMRSDGATFDAERAELARALPALFQHFARVCLATRTREWARSQPEVDDGPNFGTLSHAGYARAFYDTMEESVIPGLVAIGLPEATAAYEAFASGQAP